MRFYMRLSLDEVASYYLPLLTSPKMTCGHIILSIYPLFSVCTVNVGIYVGRWLGRRWWVIVFLAMEVSVRTYVRLGHPSEDR